MDATARIGRFATNGAEVGNVLLRKDGFWLDDAHAAPNGEMFGPYRANFAGDTAPIVAD